MSDRQLTPPITNGSPGFPVVGAGVSSGTALDRLEAAVLVHHLGVVRRAGARNGRGKPRIAVYARYSKVEQNETSIERQVNVATRYLRRIGQGEFKLYADRGKSGRSAAARAELQRLLKDCRAGLIDVIVVEDFDRWSREVYDAVQIAEELERLGVEFHCGSEERRFDKDDVVYAALRAERDRTRRRNLTSAGRMQLAMNGGAPRGPIYGLGKSKRRGYLTIVEKEAAVIRSIFEMADGGMSLTRIARRLTEDGVLNPSGEYNWSKPTIQAILSQPMYVGRIIYGCTESIYDRKEHTSTEKPRPVNEIARGYNEDYRIVSDEIFLRVKFRAGGPNGSKGRKKKPSLLGGVGKCDCPGNKYAYTFNGEYLKCTHLEIYGTCHRTTSSIPVAPIELGVIRAVAGRLRSTDGETQFAEAFRESRRAVLEAHAARRAVIVDRIEELERDLDRMMDDDIQAKYAPERIARRERSVQDGIDELNEELRRLKSPLAEPPDPSVPFATLASALERIEGRLPFKVQSPADHEFVKAMRRIVTRVDILREGRPEGDVRLVVHADFGALLDEGDDDPVDVGDCERIEVDIKVPHTKAWYRRVRGDAEGLMARGGYGLTDAQWESVAGILPDVTGADAETRHLTTRQVADALLLRLLTGHPLKARQPVDSKPIAKAVKRFVWAGGYRILADVVGRGDPAWEQRFDLRVLTTTETVARFSDKGRRGRLPQAVALHVMDGTTALTDAEWDASAPLIDPRVALGPGDPDGPAPRLMVEGVLLKLRTGLPWWELPARFGDPDVLNGLARRLVNGGSWARLVDLWRQDFPHLVEDLDAGPLKTLAVGFPRWTKVVTGPSRRRKPKGAQARARAGDGDDR